MKKLLVLALVLTVSTMASAAFVVNVTGDVASFSSDVTIAPAGGLEMYWALLVEGGGTLAGGVAVPVATALNGFSLMNYGDASASGYGNGEYGSLFTTGSAIPAGVLFDSFVLSGNVTKVSLYKLADDFSGTDGAALATYSVPEPITVALLGLGGLFIRRRKVA